MIELITHITTIMGILVGVWLGYKIGRRDDKIIQQHIPDMELIDTNEETEAPKSEDEIRKDMEYSRSLAGGFDFDG